MDLILWRHGEAESGERDLDRRLTTKGRKHAERMGGWLDGRLPENCRILVSPADGAQETARAIKRKFKTVADLAPGASPTAVLVAARWPDSKEPVLIVGHQPTLGMVVSFLLGGEEAPWSIRKAGIWWLTNRDRDGSSSVTLRCVMAPDFI